MGKYFLLALAFLFLSFKLHPQWFEQTLPLISNYKTIYFTDIYHGWAAGENGTIIHTTNGGSEWEIQNSSINSTLNKIYFIDNSNGYCAGRNGLIIKTTNGGNTWDTSFVMEDELGFPYPNESEEYYSIHFTDINKGFAVGKHPIGAGNPQTTFSYTTDSGITWNSLLSQFPGDIINDIYFSDENNGWLLTNYTGWDVIGYGWIFKTTDGGITWQDISPDTLIQNTEWGAFDISYFSSVFFINKDVGWVAGSYYYGSPGNGFIFFTQDGGKTWSVKFTGTTAYSDIHFMDAGYGWAIGSYTNLNTLNLSKSTYPITNSHKNYDLIKNPNIKIKSNDHKAKRDPNIVKMNLVEEVKWRIHNTSNSGESWASLDFNIELNEIFFLDKENGWLVGSGKIFKYVPQSSICTFDQGYWKTHSEFGPAPYDDTWALLPNGAYSPFYLSDKTYYEVLWTMPRGNPYYILAHHYIAASLNELNGANVSAITAELTQAKALFNAYTPAQIAVLKASNNIRKQFLNLTSVLNKYNDGVIGPGQCNGSNETNSKEGTEFATSSEDLSIESSTLPPEYSLKQNYPNPFNPSTIITFELPEHTKVRITIYDITGQVVATLVNMFLPAGKYKYNWTVPDGSTAGIYLYRMETPNYSASHKMILMK